jgi:AcrR family transcriptional regulator
MLDKAKPARARKAARAGGWTQNPDAVRRDILEAARAEFVANGLSGARVDAIAARTSTAKRMIYYYFGDKEGLYRAVLEQAYASIRELERSLNLDDLDPADALDRLIGFTFDYHADHPDFVRLVMVENIHHARHLKTSKNMVRSIYERGVGTGVFRRGLDPVDIHLTITALSFYNVSNRATIGQVFGHDMGAPVSRARRRLAVIDIVGRYVRQ